METPAPPDDQVTVVVDGRLLAAKVWSGRVHEVMFLAITSNDKIFGAFLAQSEGVTWCRGHDGPAVAALEVSVALRSVR